MYVYDSFLQSDGRDVELLRGSGKGEIREREGEVKRERERVRGRQRVVMWESMTVYYLHYLTFISFFSFSGFFFFCRGSSLLCMAWHGTALSLTIHKVKKWVY